MLLDWVGDMWTYLTKMRHAKVSEKGAKDAKSARHPERMLSPRHRELRPGILLNDREDVGSDEGANLAGGGSHTVELAPDGCSAALGCDETDIVARS